jgi:hypothetical protein
LVQVTSPAQPTAAKNSANSNSMIHTDAEARGAGPWIEGSRSLRAAPIRKRKLG